MLETNNNLYDIIGDVHGCYDELIMLIKKLGYDIKSNHICHEQNRKLIFVGDLVDRGPASDKVLDFVMRLKEQNMAECVIGNHDDKLYRKLMNRDVIIAHGLENTLEQLKSKEAFFQQYITFLQSLPPYLELDNGKLIVSHAAFNQDILNKNAKHIRQYCMYGPTEKAQEMSQLPQRINWAQSYTGQHFIVYGHTVVDNIEIINNTVCIDTGCVFGGHLTAMKYPEKQFLSVQAKAKYYNRRL